MKRRMSLKLLGRIVGSKRVIIIIDRMNLRLLEAGRKFKKLSERE